MASGNRGDDPNKPPKAPTSKDITNREYFSADQTHQSIDDLEDLEIPETPPETSPEHIRSSSTESHVNISNEKEEKPSPTASDVLANADVRDVEEWSKLDMQMRREFKSSKERKRALVELQKKREMEREEAESEDEYGRGEKDEEEEEGKGKGKGVKK